MSETSAPRGRNSYPEYEIEKVVDRIEWLRHRSESEHSSRIGLTHRNVRFLRVLPELVWGDDTRVYIRIVTSVGELVRTGARL